MSFLTYSSSRWRRNWFIMAALVATLISCIPNVMAEKTQADYYVDSLPGAPTDRPLEKMFAGHVEISPETHGNLFFWFFENKHIADKQRLVIWLNGGPGCSSEDGALMEIGPYRVREGGRLENINGSWNEFANLLFVDNPVGTGYSYVDTSHFVRELQEMADQFVKFLDKWFELFPEYSLDDIYIAGESYAGQHIPYIAKTILDLNKSRQRPINLQGILIGNGWISGVDQYPAYAKFAYQNGIIKAGTQEAQMVESKWANCMQLLSAGGKDNVDVTACEAVLSEILAVTAYEENGKRMCYNMYDVRLRDESPACGMNWPPDLDHVTPYLRRQDVMNALHINAEHRNGWQECNGAVGAAFEAKTSTPSVRLLPDILSQIPVVLFSGDKDLICNHLGTEELIHNLEWNGGKGFEQTPGGLWAPRRAWSFDGEPTGFYQEARNLTYVLFYNSSHMVPFDLPRQTRDMVDRFMGVDISYIGGTPALSIIEGEKERPATSVGATPNSTLAKQEQGEKIADAVTDAYKKSGEVALVVVAIAACAWGFFICRARRRRTGGGARYKGLFSSDPDDDAGAFGLEARSKRRADSDIEAAAAFDERELDDFGVDSDEDLEGDGSGKEASRQKGEKRT